MIPCSLVDSNLKHDKLSGWIELRSTETGGGKWRLKGKENFLSRAARSPDNRLTEAIHFCSLLEPL